MRLLPGSSPRMRGTPLTSNTFLTSGRFIPAHAGNTTPALLQAHQYPVHPRACGEHAVDGDPHVASPGSSPRMRGTRVIGGGLTLKRRFIPAHAGNTSPAHGARGLRTVHPRACGEHLRELQGLVGFYGSSPRMRGTPGHGRIPRRSLRFIPAHAGNTR